MPLDAVALRAQTNELRGLIGFKIDKIQQPERDMIVLVLRGEGSTKRLLLSANSANPRIHLTASKFENPDVPPMFCMLLRKHLSGGKLTDVRQLGFERIVDIGIESYTELGELTQKHLLCEIMGRNSNLIFLNEDMKIIDSIKHVDITVSSVRNILPGLKYMLPPDGGRLDPLESSAADFLKVLENADDAFGADKALTGGVCGISPLLARECVFDACGDGNMRVGEMSANMRQKTAVCLEKMFDRVRANDFAPCVVFKEDGTAGDFAPFIIRQYGGRVRMEAQPDMNTATELFYSVRDRDARMKNHSAATVKIINNSLSRATKKLALLQNDLKASMDREKYRIYGDLLMANLYAVNKGDKSVTVVNYYDADQKEITIPLDVTKSPSQNARNFYNKYRKAKNTEIYASEQINITKSEIEYLESVLLETENARSLAELREIRDELENEGYIKTDSAKKRRRPQPSAPMEFEYMGYTILVGRNNVQNDYLTLKIGRSRDLWLHTKNIPGSHTLIKYQGEDFPPAVITAAASLAAYFSKGKNAPKVEVDYCPVSHVKKPNGAKAGMVIYEGYNTAFVEPGKELAEKLGKNN